jgi:hypothetical protein
LIEKYNNNPNTNGQRSIRSIRSKWTGILQTFRRLDQEASTGTPPLAPWTFHQKLLDIAAAMANVVPQTVYSSFMNGGVTVDNQPENMRANTSRSGTRNRTRTNSSVQQLIDAADAAHTCDESERAVLNQLK